MANEARITSSLQIIFPPGATGNINYQSQPTAFNADVSTALGPTPGAIVATVAGVDVSLAVLTVPGFCRIRNLDETNFVEVGIWDGVSFYPFMDILAGESYIVRLSASLGDEFGTGTGTSGPGINTLRVKADTASCNVVVEAFER